VTIYPTDFVWFTNNGLTQLGRFDHLSKDLQQLIDKLFTARYHKPYLMFDVYSKIDIHLILPKEAEEYAEKILILSKGLNKPINSILRLPGGDHWLHGEVPKFGPVDAFTAMYMPRDGWKKLALNYVDWLCKFLQHSDEIPTFDKVETEKYKPLALPLGGELVSDFLTRIRILEEKPMKVTNYMVELQGYNREEKTPTKDKELILVKVRANRPMTPRDVFLTLESMYVDPTDHWNVLHGILTIEGGHYKFGSGNVGFEQKKFDILTKQKGVFLEIDLSTLVPYRLYLLEGKYDFKTGKHIDTLVEQIIKLPRTVKINDVLNYYKQKYPIKKYSLTNDIIKKTLSERSLKLKELPRVGETPVKNLRKVCYRKVDTPDGIIGRASYDDVKKLVDGGKYEFVPKAAWKRQLVSEDNVLLIKGEANKSNITHSPSGRELGDRKMRKATREDDKKLKSIQKAMRQNQSTRIPGDAERKLQSSADKQKYAEMCIKSGKKRVSYPVSRAFEAIILGDKAVVLQTIQIKAKSNDHAEKILKVIMKNKGCNAKLTGTIRDWKRQVNK